VQVGDRVTRRHGPGGHGGRVGHAVDYAPLRREGESVGC
jgi:hypothetical protein